MARTIKALGLWMNGFRVGRWERRAGGNDRLSYDPDWVSAPQGRPLSLSLPFTRGHGHQQTVPLQGPMVGAWFANLLPDNDHILQRLQQRYRTATRAPFDLLAAIGRDCAGAIQLLPHDETPDPVQRIDATPLDEAGVATVLRETTLGPGAGWTPSDGFRLSIAGAQEKTALLRHQGQWCIPHGSTPSTHIFKLPLGRVGNMQADLRDSVELEWLCMELAREFGLPVARVEIGRFEDQRALVVERFDRKLSADGRWWQRIPQEDFCQVFGLAPTLKYEADGGPGIRRIMEVLRGAEQARQDRRTFFTAQVVFWLLAATDGHAKNFSVQILPGGAYRLTPLYDVLSTWPIQGHGHHQLDPRKARLAMAVDGRNRHYKLVEIHRRHWMAMAGALGLEEDPSALLDQLVAEAPAALDRLAERLPPDYPERLFASVARGVRGAAKRLASAAA